MDNFENTDFDEVPYQSQDQESSSYHSAGTGRKESPYANSPYVMNQPQSEYQYQPQTEKPVKPKKEKKPRKPMGKKILSVVLILVLVLGSCAATSAIMNYRFNNEVESMLEQHATEIGQLREQIENLDVPHGSSTVLPTDGSAMTPAQLYASQVDSVVAISSTVQTNSYYGTSQGTSAGSGFILTEDGYVITNYHVVEGASKVEVITHDGTEYEAKVVGHDESNDLAVLKVEATGLAAATLGSSTDLVIGDMVVAIGNPLGELAATQTVGYVSGIDREVSTGNVTTINMIQTDAAINPGNSGGPLFNMYGEVIGITTAKYSGTTGSGASIEGIGFAIPIDDVEPLIDDIIDYGYVTGAYMGVRVQDTDAESAEMFGLPTGAYIVSVDEGGAADRAGIQPKDIVIALGEYEVSNTTELTRALRKFKAGDTTTIKVIRSGRELTLDITLDEKPQNTTEETLPQEQPQQPSREDAFDDLYEYFRRYFGG